MLHTFLIAILLTTSPLLSRIIKSNRVSFNFSLTTGSRTTWNNGTKYLNYKSDYFNFKTFFLFGSNSETDKIHNINKKKTTAANIKQRMIRDMKE